IGSATVTSSQPLVAVVNQVGKNAPNKTLLTYSGFPSGAATVALPLVMANNSGIFTGIAVQNTSNSSANRTVTYGPDTVSGMATPAHDVFTLAAGAGTALLQAGGKWTGRYVGSATITATGGQIVAIVNQLVTTGVNQGTAYEGFVNPASATSKVSAPLLMSHNSALGFFTAVQCQNVGQSSVTLNVSYSANVAGTFTPPAEPARTIAPGASVTVFQAGASWTGRYVGGGTFSATGPIACIVNEAASSASLPGDVSGTYDGINF